MGWIVQVAMGAVGVVSMGFGLFWLLRVWQSPSRQASGVTKMTLPAYLIGVRWLGVGVAWVIWALTLSNVAVACACVLMLSEIPIRWLVQRRAGQVDRADLT